MRPWNLQLSCRVGLPPPSPLLSDSVCILIQPSLTDSHYFTDLQRAPAPLPLQSSFTDVETHRTVNALHCCHISENIFCDYWYMSIYMGNWYCCILTEYIGFKFWENSEPAVGK